MKSKRVSVEQLTAALKEYRAGRCLRSRFAAAWEGHRCTSDQ